MTLRFIAVALLGVILTLTGCAPVEKKDNPDAHYMLGVSYLRAGDSTMALKEFLQAEKNDPDNAELHAALGQAYMLKNAYMESEKHYRLSLQLDKGNPHTQNNLAALFLKMERYDAAIEYFRLAASNLLFPRPEVSWTGLGYAQFRNENYPEALEAFEHAISANWRFQDIYVRRGEVYYALGKTDKAISEYMQALEPGLITSPATTTLAHYNLGVAHLKQRNPELAVKHFETVLERSPQGELGRQSKSFLSVLK